MSVAYRQALLRESPEQAGEGRERCTAMVEACRISSGDCERALAATSLK
jgi:hypothetical protein